MKEIRRIQGTTVKVTIHNRRESLLVSHLESNIDYLFCDDCPNQYNWYTHQIEGIVESLWYMDIITNRGWKRINNLESLTKELVENL